MVLFHLAGTNNALDGTHLAAQMPQHAQAIEQAIKQVRAKSLVCKP
jgi:hypothetical protein